MLLEMPPEVRMMIYEELAKSISAQIYLMSGWRYLAAKCHDPERTAFAMAQVNRQIRSEATSILYRHTTIQINSDLYRSQGALEAWLQTTNALVFQSLSKFNVAMETHKGGFIRIDLGNIAKPVTFAYYRRASFAPPDPKPDIVQAFEKTVREEVKALRNVGSNGIESRVMTKETIENIISLALEADEELRRAGRRR